MKKTFISPDFAGILTELLIFWCTFKDIRKCKIKCLLAITHPLSVSALLLFQGVTFPAGVPHECAAIAGH